MPKKKRADGRYAASVYLGKGDDGKRKYKTVYGRTQKEANQKADEVRSQIGRGYDVLSAGNTFKEWAELFLASEKSKLTEAVYRKKKSNIEEFYADIGSIPILSIKPLNIQPRINSIYEFNPYTHKQSSYKTMKEYKNNVSAVFRYAMLNRAIEFNPCDAVTVAKNSPTKERRALTRTERELIGTFSCYARLPAMLSLYAGLRRGEMTALTWNDVDLENRVINVNKSYNEKTKSIKGTKTASGMRSVPIPQILLEELNRIPEEQRTGNVLTINGKPITEGWWRSMQVDLLREMEEKAKNENQKPVEKTIAGKRKIFLTVEPFDWHCLRHTYATILYESGTDVLTAKELLGHSDIATTMKIYTHLSAEKKKNSIEKLNDFLNCKSNASQDESA